MSAEYPKVIKTGSILVTVQNAEDEARWPPPDPEPETDAPATVSSDPLDDIVLDGAAMNDGHAPEPDERAKKGSSAKKK